ncbi:MAG: molecular chaperone DnaJ, partial [Myxococcales bacterium]|nr:molecular chaperone DnaJ [Myxococcales bacterium]
MPNTQVAEALFDAHALKATGAVTCSHRGRETRLFYSQGDLVDVDGQFGIAAPLQGLLRDKRLALSQFDALWARGEVGQTDPETFEELGLTEADERSARLLASVRNVVATADGARFEEMPVEGAAQVPGAAVARLAFEVASTSHEAPWVRVKDLSRAAAFLSDDERALVSGWTNFVSGASMPAAQRPLLEVLLRSGALDSVPAEEWRRREEEARIAEEKRQADEAARIAEEKRQAEEAARLAEEARVAEEKRQAEEAARLAEEARVAEEKRQAEEAARLAEEARVAEEKRQAEEAARLAEEARVAEEKRQAEEAARLAEEARVAEEKR